MKKYFVYLDDSNDCYKVAVPAKNEKDARSYVTGNGEVIAIKDVTEEYPISLSKVVDALQKAGFGSVEIDFIQRTLGYSGIAE